MRILDDKFYEKEKVDILVGLCNCKYDDLYSTISSKLLLGCFTRLLNIKAKSQIANNKLWISWCLCFAFEWHFTSFMITIGNQSQQLHGGNLHCNVTLDCNLIKSLWTNMVANCKLYCKSRLYPKQVLSSQHGGQLHTVMWIWIIS